MPSRGNIIKKMAVFGCYYLPIGCIVLNMYIFPPSQNWTHAFDLIYSTISYMSQWVLNNLISDIQVPKFSRVCQRGTGKSDVNFNLPLNDIGKSLFALEFRLIFT